MLQDHAHGRFRLNSAIVRDLTNDEFRHEFMMDQVRSYIAFQIRALREQPGRRWSQVELADRAGKKQSVISRAEDPDYGKLSLQSLLEIAIAFDIPLLVQFAEWEDWLERMNNQSPSALRKRSFSAERLFRLAVPESFSGLKQETHSQDHGVFGGQSQQAVDSPFPQANINRSMALA